MDNTKTKLFNDIQRFNKEPARYNESTFDYYQRSDRNDISIIRDMLEDWFSDYPESEKDELKSRFKNAFYDCFYELFLFKLFKSLGFVIEIHPVLFDSSKRPDFLVVKQDLRVYIEAKTVHGKSHSEEAYEKFVNQIYDDLNKLKVKGHVFHFEKFEIKTKMQPSTNDIIEYIVKEADRIISIGSIADDKIKYQSDDFHLIASLIPLKDKSKEYSERPIGIHPIELFYDGGESHIRKAILGKGRKYGKLDSPYIVCINAIGDHVTSDEDIESAILGSIAMEYKDGSDDPGRLVHLDNGVFHSNGRPKLRNVSGIFVTQVFPHNIDSANYYLYQHPCTENFLDFNLLGLEYWFLNNEGYMQRVLGKSIVEIFDRLN